MGAHPWSQSDLGEPKNDFGKDSEFQRNIRNRTGGVGALVALAAKIWEWNWMELTLKDVEEQLDPEEKQQHFFSRVKKGGKVIFHDFP